MVSANVASPGMGKSTSACAERRASSVAPTTDAARTALKGAIPPHATYLKKRKKKKKKKGLIFCHHSVS
jgi:hypothetical protein